MRLSVEQDDPGFCPEAFAARAYLDDVELKACVTADEELGEAVCLAVDDQGRTYFDPATGQVARVVVKGRIRLEVAPKTA